MAGEGFTPISLGDLSIRWRGEGLHVAQEAAYGQEVAQGFAVIVAGQPGFTALAGVQFGVVPQQLPGCGRATTFGGTLNGVYLDHSATLPGGELSAGRPRGKSPGDTPNLTRLIARFVQPWGVPVPADRAERSTRPDHGDHRIRRVMLLCPNALSSVV